jgi:hypothetical protein
MNLTLQRAGSHESESLTVGESWGVMGFTPHRGPSLRVARASASCAALGSVFSPQSSLLHQHGSRQGQSFEAVVAADSGSAAHAQEAGRGGRPLHERARRVLGALRCRRQEENLQVPGARVPRGLHKLSGGVPPSAAFEVQEMGETGGWSRCSTTRVPKTTWRCTSRMCRQR